MLAQFKTCPKVRSGLGKTTNKFNLLNTCTHIQLHKLEAQNNSFLTEKHQGSNKNPKINKDGFN